MGVRRRHALGPAFSLWNRRREATVHCPARLGRDAASISRCSSSSAGEDDGSAPRLGGDILEIRKRLQIVIDSFLVFD